MPMQQRKERERATRHRLIVSTARELAETEGWDAVTTRRLAERIEYSQPVLYSHFRGKDEIVAAVALEGFDDLAAGLHRAVSPPGSDAVAPRTAVAALAAAYVGFAERSPAVYDAMFTLSTGLRFADEATPAALHGAFDVLLAALTPVAGGAAPTLFAELGWAALHGLVTLTRAGRLPPEHAARRLDLLVDLLTGG